MIVSSLFLITHHTSASDSLAADDVTILPRLFRKPENQGSLPAQVIETYARKGKTFCALINFCYVRIFIDLKFF